MAYPNVIIIVDGKPVSAGTINVPIDNLTERTDFLKGQLENLQFTSGRIILSNQQVVDTVLDSNLVYLDEAEEKWGLARANTTFIPNSTRFSLEEEAFVQGIAKNISGPSGNRVADIYLYGLVDNVNNANLIDDGQSFKSVNFWLSTSVQGKMTKTRPAAAQVFLGKFITLNNFLFTPNISDAIRSLLSHDHVLKPLDSSKWLVLDPGPPPRYLYPASEFDIFPPTPVDLSTLLINGIPQKYGDNFFVDADGLHYEPIEEDYVVDLDPDVFESEFAYIQVNSEGSKVVSSLSAGDNSVIVRDRISGDPATTGDLEILANFDIVEDTVFTSDNVVKNINIDGEGNLVQEKGPFVESIDSGDGISISNTGSKYTISASTSAFGDTKIVDDIVLLGARSEVSIDETMSYINMFYNLQINPGLLAKLYFGASDRDIVLFGNFFGISSGLTGTVNLRMTYKVIEEGSPITSAGVTTTTSFQVNNNVSRNQLLVLPAKQNSTVSIKIERLNSGGTLAGDLGLTFLEVE